MNNLKIYCQTQEDQSNIFDFLFYEYQNDIKYSTWEPDGDDENPGTWGMFIDDFPPELVDKLSKDEMRAKIKEFSALLKSQREHWDEENKQGFTYSCDMISQSLITLYIRLGRD